MVPNYMQLSLIKFYLSLMKNVFYVASFLGSNFLFPHRNTAEYWLQYVMALPATMSFVLFQHITEGFKVLHHLPDSAST